MSIFFYDSYALIEYLNNTQHFFSYFEEHTGVLSLLNLLEVYYHILNNYGVEKADFVLEKFSPLIVEPSHGTIKKAMQFRLLHKKSNLSYADCLGYQIALERGIPFLTGDRAFKDMKNVELVR